MKKNKRKIDKAAGKTAKSMNQFVLVKKIKLLSWKTAIPTAFVIGMVIAISAITHFRLQTMSKANPAEASIFFYPHSFNALNVGSTFTTTVFVDTKGNDVVAATANVSYDPSVLQLENYDLSGSIFANSECEYNGSLCKIIENNASLGKITITMGKPAPGLNTASGEIAKLTFKALKPIADSRIKLSFSGVGNYEDSNVVVNDGMGTDILNFVSDAAVTIDGSSACNNLSFVAGVASPVSVALNDVYKISCDYGMAAIDSVKAKNDIGECLWMGWDNNAAIFQCNSGPLGTRSNTCSLIIGTSSNTCAKTNSINNVVVAKNLITCTRFTYSSWGSCINGVQTRTVTSSSPSGCTGGKPVLSRSCKVKRWFFW